MNRLLVLAACAALVGTTLLVTATSASAHDTSKVTLYGFVKGVKTDGAFSAKVSFIDPITNQTLAKSKTTVDIQNGEYHAVLDAPGLDKNATYKVSMEGLEAAKDFTVIDYVQLQSSTPGSQQTGHLNISGSVLASRIGLGVSPTLAKVQVNETGTAQGVRSITNSGTAVYGQATASSGLAAGGYFTTSSVGGRAIVGDALSTTGSTVGGLFYNRSSDGVAIWGRHIKTTGNSIGVFGQTASGGGTAIMAQNTGTGDTVELAGPNGSIQTTGRLPSHEYKTNEIHPMVPIAYGLINDSAVIVSGSGNFSCTQSSTGIYHITIDGYSALSTNTVCLVTPFYTGARASVQIANNELIPQTTNSSNTAISTPFYFVAYTTASFSPPLRTSAPPRAAQGANKVQVPIPYDENEPAGQPMNHILPPRN